MLFEFVEPSTENFDYQCDAKLPGADVRTVALQASCERDLARLEPFFGVSGGFGSGNRVTVLVASSPGLGGNNSGYSTDVPMVIALDFLPDGPDAVRLTRSIFVDELAEILMDHRNRVIGMSTWNKGASDWEGLSRVCGAELYPGLGPDEGLNAWMAQNPRNYQWIDASEPTDQHRLSWGISILFINYLRTQLGFSLSEIIQRAGSSLAETYHNLTGRTDARAAFEDLIERFLPAGQVDRVARDNPFPFLQPNRRSVSLNSTSTIAEGSELLGLGGEVLVSPGGFCPKELYSYSVHADTETALITAATHGFGRPLFRWTIAGIRPPLPGHDDVSVTIRPTVTVGVEHPETPGIFSWTTETAMLDYERNGEVAIATDEVKIKNLDHLGLEQFAVSVEVVDQYAFPDWTTATAASDYITLTGRSIRREPRFELDKERCDEAMREFIRNFTRFRQINILLTLPDPPVISITTMIGQIIYELGLIAEDLPEQSVAVATAVGELLGVSGTQLLAGKLVIPSLEVNG